MVDLVVIRKVCQLLAAVESQEDIRVLLAVESGSRAWGFPSRDSDYDVRFMYVHQRDWYLSIDADTKRDVIERPLADMVDLSGWDIRKALRLFSRANPPLIEWLSSPMVYLDRDGFRAELVELLPTYYQPRTCMYHYLHMAQNNRREYLNGTIVWLKKYLYVLRPILAARWIEQGRGPVPMEFRVLLGTIGSRTELLQAITNLIDRKQKGDELDRGAAIPVISTFIDEEMERMSKIFAEKETGTVDLKPLQKVFMRHLADVEKATT